MRTTSLVTVLFLCSACSSGGNSGLPSDLLTGPFANATVSATPSPNKPGSFAITLDPMTAQTGPVASVLGGCVANYLAYANGKDAFLLNDVAFDPKAGQTLTVAIVTASDIAEPTTEAAKPLRNSDAVKLCSSMINAKYMWK